MAKRTQKCKKVYLGTEGESQSFKEGVTGMEFRFDGGGTHGVDYNQLPDGIKVACGWHGLSQKLGDAYSGAKSVEDAEEKFSAMLEQLQAGNWLTEREGSGVPRISLIFTAVVEVYKDNGIELNEEDQNELREALKEKGAAKAAEDQNPAVAAKVAELRAKAAAERAAKAAEKAKGEAFTGLNLVVPKQEAEANSETAEDSTQGSEAETATEAEPAH